MALSRPRERRILLLVALLTIGFALTAALAYHAQDAARSHRATAERTLRDYASLAALQFATYAKEGMYMHANSVLYRKVDFAGKHGPAPVPEVGADGPGCTVPGARPDSTLVLFTMDLERRAITAMRNCAGPVVRRWLRDTVTAHAEAYKRTWDHADLVATVDGERWLVAYAVRFDDWGEPAKAFGFLTPFRGFAKPAFAGALRWYPLLPPTLVGKTPNDSLLSVTVTDGEGVVLYQSKAQYASPYTAVERSPKFGGMVVQLTLRPEVADRLVIGGLPRSRLPLLLGLLALAGAMMVVALLQLRREYELARLRADFVSSISHELRTPLAQVRMFAETLLLGRVRSEAERRRSLEIIDQEARRLTHLVENVLQFSRSERHVTRLAPEPTDIAGQVDEAVEAFAPLAHARRVTVATALVDGVVAQVDRAALRQTLLNLLDNAVKYGPEGQTVRVGMAAGEGRLRLWVDDEGPGIAARERERIWTPFYRLERDAGSAVAGSGIGLAVVRDLVTMHGGRAWAEEAPSGGARFVIELPCERGGVPCPRAESVAPPTLLPARHGEAPVPADGD